MKKTMYTYDHEKVLVNPAQFVPGELSENAFQIYSTSDFDFYVDESGNYYADMDGSGKLDEVGSISDVEEFLIEFYCEEV